MSTYLKRRLAEAVLRSIKAYPVTVILGPRQVGKSTLAKELIPHFRNSLYLDLERPSHLSKLEEAEYFLSQHKKNLICLDEIQRLPEIFPLLRSLVDEDQRNGRFLILGSAGKELLRQSSESLAGRIAYWELSPFNQLEISDKAEEQLWFRGGFPKSFLSSSERESGEWREHYIRSFLESELPQWGFRRLQPLSMNRLLSMLAHNQGQILNISKLASSLGLSSPTIQSYLDILEKTFLIRRLPAYFSNLKKRLIKSPKIYVRDSGILHSLLQIEDFKGLFGHPVFGPSFEGFVVENIIACLPQWEFYFYRTKSGAEIDLLLLKGRQRLAVEIKASPSPSLKKGFWTATQDVKVNGKYLIAPVKSPFYLKGAVKVLPLSVFLKEMTAKNKVLKTPLIL